MPRAVPSVLTYAAVWGRGMSARYNSLLRPGGSGRRMKGMTRGSRRWRQMVMREWQKAMCDYVPKGQQRRRGTAEGRAWALWSLFPGPKGEGRMHRGGSA